MTAPSGDATQKWVITRQAQDGSYTLKNASTGLCADVPYSSTEDGAAVGQYTCSGTPNQRFTVVKDGSTVKLVQANSGLSLTANADGSVTQATDTGAATQRWSAAAN